MGSFGHCSVVHSLSSMCFRYPSFWRKESLLDWEFGVLSILSGQCRAYSVQSISYDQEVLSCPMVMLVCCNDKAHFAELPPTRNEHISIYLKAFICWLTFMPLSLWNLKGWESAHLDGSCWSKKAESMSRWENLMEEDVTWSWNMHQVLC